MAGRSASCSLSRPVRPHSQDACQRPNSRGLKLAASRGFLLFVLAGKVWPFLNGFWVVGMLAKILPDIMIPAATFLSIDFSAAYAAVNGHKKRNL